MNASREAGRTRGPLAGSYTARDDFAPLPGLRLVPMLAGGALVWAWLLCVLFVLQPDFVGVRVQTCALCGCAAALTLFAALDSRGMRGPEPSRRRAVEVAAWVVCTLVTVSLFPLGTSWQIPNRLSRGALDVLWALAGALAAYPVRRTHFLFSALARCLAPAALAQVAAGSAIAAGLLALLAAHTDSSTGTAFVLVAAPLASLLLPPGVPSLPGARRETAGHSEGDASAAGASHVRGPLRAPLLLALAAVGLTCGFHTVVGRIVYSGLSQFNPVFLSVVAAGLLYGIVARRCSARSLRTTLLLSLAGCSVVFAPFLFLSAMPDSLAWELIQDGLVFLSCCALLPLFAQAAGTYPGGTSRRQDRSATSRAAAVLLCGLALGWACGQLAWAAGGLDGIAFKLCVTACIALVVGAILVLTAAGEPDVRPADANPGDEHVLIGEDGPLGSAAPIQEATCTGGACHGTSSRGTAAPSPASGAIGSTQAPDAAAGQPTTSAPASRTSPAPSTNASPTLQDSGASEPICDPRVDAVAWRFGLSEREHALLYLLAEGLGTQDAAERLCVSRNTVKSHMAHIYAKTCVHTRAELDELLEGAVEEA